MEKQKYFVSVQSQSILGHRGDAAYELEIEATPEEVEKLRALFVMLQEFDHDAFFRSFTPAIPYHHDRANDGYDYYLREIYQYIHRLGTEQTKQHIASITNELNNTGANEELDGDLRRNPG